MPLRNKILIGVVVVLAGLVFFVRFNFKSTLSDFKETLSSFEKDKLVAFQMEKNNKLNSIKDSSIRVLFAQQYNDSLALKRKDSTCRFMYLSETVSYNLPKTEYLECLYQKCSLDSKNDSCQKLIEPKISYLEKKYGETFTEWYSKLKKDKLLKQRSVTLDCGAGFDSLFQISYDEDAWKDFEKFLATYQKDKSEIERGNQNIDGELERMTASTRSKLKTVVLPFFNSSLTRNKNGLLKTEIVSKQYDGKSLGAVNYSFSQRKVDKDLFKSIADEAFEEQWRYNSLNQGSMPYASCYGSNNGCGGYGCSQISVLSGSSDVLVTIKNSSGNVCRHGYIKAGRSFKFNVPNGGYQVFFYSGTGWNPNKVMATTSCGTLRGGFMSGESFTKDNYIDLDNQIMSYELILQQNGNLSTQPSSKSEAFD